LSNINFFQYYFLDKKKAKVDIIRDKPVEEKDFSDSVSDEKDEESEEVNDEDEEFEEARKQDLED
jgi:hypothetical protein